MDFFKIEESIEVDGKKKKIDFFEGMAKATKYTVLKDDIGTTSDAMQSLMGALCFEHQVKSIAHRRRDTYQNQFH